MRQSLSILGLAMLVASSAVGDDRDCQDGDVLELALRVALVDESAVQVDPTEARLLARTEHLLRGGNVDRALSRWSQVIESRALSGAPMDIATFVQWVLRASYLESSEDLRQHAEKVRYFNKQKKQVRELLNDARRCRWLRCASDDAVMAHIEKWEQDLQSVGDDAQLANIELQNALQQQQQTLQTISNVSKLLHDTAQSVIRKIGG